MQPDINIATLVSIGLHPRSGRSRRAEQDARAVELGLQLCGDQLQLVHAGKGHEQVLRLYLGMGLKQMTLLQQNDNNDALPAIADYLSEQTLDIILAGGRAESGEASGMLPYLLAEKLGWSLVSNIIEIVNINSDGNADVLQALPRGQRRALKVRLPLIATVDIAAPKPRQAAFGPGQRAIIDTISVPGATVDVERSCWQIMSARKQPKRLNIVKAKSAADRFKVATAKAESIGGKILKNESAVEKAQAILDFLLDEGVYR